MNATRWMASLAVATLLGLFCWSAAPVLAQDAGGAAPKQQPYTMPEYNAYTAAAGEKNPAQQIKDLDDFVAKFPNSALLHFVYPLYYKNYLGQKNFQKAIEYADKEIALGDKATPTDIYEAYYVRAAAYNNLQNPDAQTAKAAREAALAGLKSINLVPKPEGLDEAKFADQKKLSTIFFQATAGSAALAAKDCAGAAESYKAVLALTPDDLTANYNLGKAYSCTTPPQPLDALWSFARAATSKNANEQQSKTIKAYARKLIANHQGNTVCDPLTDAEMNELLQLASSSVDRPASYKLASSTDLDAARKDMTIASVVTDLKSGGDKAKLTWTAACGLEFPDVPGKIIDVTPGPDATILKNAFVTSDAEFDAKTTPDMEVTIKNADQPEAAKLEKGNAVRFTGTLESYDPDPAFMLHWDKAKVNAEDLPKAGNTAKKPAPRRPTKKP
jgi:tetratricopeptide (TPR) repeat protein